MIFMRASAFVVSREQLGHYADGPRVHLNPVVPEYTHSTYLSANDVTNERGADDVAIERGATFKSNNANFN